MLERWFLIHPRSVGESYLEHLKAALGFAGTLMYAALACAVHAFAPSLCVRTASRTVASLHETLVAKRARPTAAGVALREAPQPWGDYAI